DGQSFDPSFTPIITFRQHGTTFSGPFAAGNFNSTRDTAVTGKTTVTFNLSRQLADLGLTTGGTLVGAGIPDTGTGGPLPNATLRPPGTTGTITFRTKIDDFYLLQPAALAPVVQGDVMSNDVAVTGQVAAFADLSPTAARQSDHSSAKVTLP